jgi:hypothetical protein
MFRSIAAAADSVSARCSSSVSTRCARAAASTRSAKNHAASGRRSLERKRALDALYGLLTEAARLCMKSD